MTLEEYTQVLKRVQALQTIDECYSHISDIHKAYPRHPVGRWLDDISGRSTKRIKKVIEIMERMIEAKKSIDLPTADDEAQTQELKDLIT